jgi:GPH family glycoside/pentoside/hexuronide:cation symporter
MDIQANELKSSKAEKVCYAFGDVGSNFVWSFSSSFLTLYYTDSAALSAAFAGTMMLICRFFDGISDIGMGAVIDKTRARWGRARSWLLFSTVPLVLVYIATFNVPSSLGMTGKNIYAFVTYFLLSVVCYTANNLAYHAMLPRFSLSSQDRSTVSVVRTVFVLIAIMAINIVTPIVLTILGGANSQHGWTIITLIYGAMATVSLFITFFGVKEKLPVDDSGEKIKQKAPLKLAVKSLMSTRYFYIAIMLLLTYSITGGSIGTGIYYARDVLGNANLFGIMSITTVLPTLVIVPFIPALFKKFGKRNSMLYGLALSITAVVVILLTDPRNAVLYITMVLIRTIGNIPLLVAAFTLAGDIVDYNYMKTGIRAEGITTAANSVGMKIGTGLGSALLGWLLAWGHYDGTLTVQPDSAITSMITMAVVVPLIVYIIAFVLLLFWDLEKYQTQVQEYLRSKSNEGERSSPAAE